MMILNILFFHPQSLGLCMYQNTKCKHCKQCPNKIAKIKLFLRKIRRYFK